MQNPGAHSDPFAEERKEYERTIGTLYNELAESKRYSKETMEELLNKLAESEQDRMASAETRLKAEEEKRLAEEEKRLAEEKKRSAEEELRAWIEGHRDFPVVPASPDDLIDPFAKEREDYLKIIQELYDKVLRLEQREESMKAEEKQPTAAQLDYPERVQKALFEYEDLYSEEKRKRAYAEEEFASCKMELEKRKSESVEEELARCKKELEEANKAIQENNKVTNAEATNKAIAEPTKDEGDSLGWVTKEETKKPTEVEEDWVICE